MQYHKTVKEIKDLLEKHDIWFEAFEHEPVRTSEQAAKVRTGYSLKQGAKAIIVRVKTKDEKYFAMLVIPGDRRFKVEQVKKIFASKDIRFATEEEVLEITQGIEPGGVPPFGNLFGLEILVDESLFANEKIIFNAGDKRFSIAMKSQDYKALVKPRVESIVE